MLLLTNILAEIPLLYTNANWSSITKKYPQNLGILGSHDRPIPGLFPQAREIKKSNYEDKENLTWKNKVVLPQV